MSTKSVASCPICLDDFGKLATVDTLVCGHGFHGHCAERALKVSAFTEENSPCRLQLLVCSHKKGGTFTGGHMGSHWVTLGHMGSLGLETKLKRTVRLPIGEAACFGWEKSRSFEAFVAITEAPISREMNLAESWRNEVEKKVLKLSRKKAGGA